MSYIYGTPILDVSRSHNDAPQSVGLLWTSDQLVAETSTWQHTTLTTDKYPCPRWDSNSRSQQTNGLWPLAFWDLGFESHQGHGYLSVVSVVCCQVEVSATSWSLVQSSPTDCGASLCDLETSRIGAPYIYDISSLRVNDLTLILLTWKNCELLIMPANSRWDLIRGFKG